MNYKCALFCEDIRQEIGGRISLMGILGNRLVVQDFPLVFPKLCLFVEWGEVRENLNVVLNIVAPKGADVQNLQPTAQVAPQSGTLSRTLINLRNFVLPQPGEYTFEFIVNNEVVNREVLTVEKYVAPMSTSIPSSKIN